MTRRAIVASVLAMVASASACGPKAPPERAPHGPVAVRDTAGGVEANALPGEDAEAPRDAALSGNRTVRVALSTSADEVTISGTGGWRLYDSNGSSLLLRADAGVAWTVEPDHGALHARSADGERTPARDAPFVARAVQAGSWVTVNGRPFRGEVVLRPAAHGLTVVNRLSVEDYLRGVVPLEIGPRTPEERAAVEAQAIAARSYALARLRTNAAIEYDLGSTVIDQVYGGVAAETPLADAAIAATRSQVLMYQGRVIAAPYSAVCGGRTAASSEVWHADDVAYLKSVSDRVKGQSDRFYCDISPRFRWTRQFTDRELTDVLDRNLRGYVTVKGRIGAVTDLQIESRTASGRVQILGVVTEHGRYALRGNDIRFVFRSADGAILPSTMLSIALERGSDGRVERATFSGAGNGHGVGMCQWGAIGRARAGESAREILTAYYPGTVLTALPE